MDWNLVPGRNIFDKIIETSAPTDTARKIPLEWNDMLGEDVPGAVFLRAEEPPAESRASERPGTESLIQLTDIGLLWKCSRREATVYAFSHTTGKPISDATIRLMSEENEPIIEKQTDGQGLAQIPLEHEAAKGNRSHSKADRDLQPRW